MGEIYYRLTDHPNFKGWWQSWVNPGVDPDSVTLDDPCVLYHVYPDGGITRTTYFDLLRLDLWESSYKDPELAWFYAAFREIFDPDINPDVNAACIRVDDKNKFVRYRTTSGGIGSVVLYDLFVTLLEQHKILELPALPVFTKLHMYKAVYHPLFREWWQQWMNRGIDPDSIYTHDDRQFHHAYPDGRLQSVTIYNLLAKKRLIEAGKRDPKNAWSYAAFRETYDPDLNPNIDLMRLHINDADSVLSIRRQNGTGGDLTTRCLFQRFYEEGYLTEPYAVEAMKTCGIYKGIYDPAFRQWVQAWMNPHIDVENICFGEDVLLYHAHDDGRLQTVNMRYAANIRSWDTGTIDPYKAWSYAAFRKIFTRELNPDVDIMKLGVFDGDIVLKVSGADGAVQEHVVSDLFEQLYAEGELTEKYARRVFRNLILASDPGMSVDAIAIDYTISNYVRSEKDKQLLQACTENDEFTFSCPFCGLEFTKKVSRMINVTPKCPYCHDEGEFGQYQESMTEGAYIHTKRRRYA